MPAMESAAIITGASSGIGLAIAHMLIEEGYGLTIVSRTAEKLEQAREELVAAGGDVIAYAADLSDEDAIVGSVAAHRDHFGRLDMLVNNAGVGLGQQVAKLTAKRLDIQYDTNVRAPFLYYRECVGMLRASAAERGVSRVVNTSSITAHSPQPWISAYSASKAALRAMTISMNKELASEGIHSTALCPGYVDTPLADLARQGGVPGDEMIQPADIAAAVQMLLRLSKNCIVPEIPFVRPVETAL